jgi:hypothetical protein
MAKNSDQEDGGSMQDAVDDVAPAAKIKRTRTLGAGPKADDGVKRLTRKQVKLDEETIRILTRVGGGNLSLGVREASRRIVEAKDTRKFSEVRHHNRAKEKARKVQGASSKTECTSQESTSKAKVQGSDSQP